jgi:phosphomannomutase/phosphoglucomutase
VSPAKSREKKSASALGTLQVWRLPLILLVVLALLAAGAMFGYQQYAAKAAQESEEATLAAAKAVAEQLARALDGERRKLAALFDPGELAALMEAGDEAAIAAKEAEIAAASDSVLRARLLEPGVREPDDTSNPPLGYAAIEMLRASENSGKVPPPEVHLFGKEHENLVMIWRLAAGDKLLGHLLLALDVSLLPAAMSRVTIADSYAELLQTGGSGRPLVLAKGGIAGIRKGPTTLRLKVLGTPWRVAFWPGDGLAPSDPLARVPMWALAAGGGVVLLALVGLGVSRQRAVTRARAEEREQLAERRAAAAAVKARPAAGAQPTPGSEGVEAAYAGLDEDAGEGGIVVEEEPGDVDVPAVIFRAYDVRGVVDETLTTDVARQLGRAIGSEAYNRGQQTLVVGRDGRNSGPVMQEALVEGLRATGRDVIDVGRVPTPVLYFATEYLNTGSGVMVTGSHNPPQYNGFKIMLGGETLFGDAIQALRQRIEDGDFEKGEGNTQRMEVSDEYVRRVCEDIPVALGNSFRIVVDCGNGVAGEVAPKLLRALGHDVVELYCEVDGNFPNHHPDPSEPTNLIDLMDTVKKENADLGIAFDGDGDRLGVVDPSGKIVWADRQMMLFAKDVLGRNPGAEIVFDVKCSSRLGKVIKQLGGKPIMWRTGHSFIKNKLKESGAPLAGEMSGHIFFQDRWYGFDDAIYAAARLLEILMSFKQTPAQVFAKLPEGVSTPELRVDTAEGEQTSVVTKLVASGGFADGKRTTIDGLRVDYADGWGLVRASNTTPSLVMRFEANDAEALGRIQAEFKKALTALKPDLDLPF